MRGTEPWPLGVTVVESRARSRSERAACDRERDPARGGWLAGHVSGVLCASKPHERQDARRSAGAGPLPAHAAPPGVT
jgi:hypothetical protein